MSRFNAIVPCGAFALILLVLVALGEVAAGIGPDSASATAGASTRPEHDAEGQVELVVYKSQRTLAVYREDELTKEYRVVLGLQPLGRKRHADDARTPEGLYRVVAKRPHARWQHFLALDYPNDADRRIYAAEAAAGRIPLEHGAPFGIGSAIGIHGNDRAEEQRRGVDWTKGCIALAAADIVELEKMVKTGTRVWIVP